MSKDLKSPPPAQTALNCPTNLIPDSPSSEDRFGPHQDIAKAIANLIRSGDGGRPIGLTGTWGSGKSTVVALLRKEIETFPNHRMLVFDAWAHDGDPLRRTFLQSLIRFFRDAYPNWISKESWTIREADLVRRRKVSETETSPHLTPAGKALGISALLIPVGSALFSQGLRDGASLLHTGPVSLATLFGFLLTVSPLLVLICFALAYRMKSRKGDPVHIESANLIAIFIQKAETKTRTETTETPDPTSIEFEKTFTDLMGEALEPAENRFVLVMDNLDRIEADGALKIWSTLQTFLQLDTGKHAWLKKLWVVVPFDQKSISRLWEKNAPQANESGENKKHSNFASSFLDKTFPIRFDVPPLVLSDWRAYLIEMLREAFPNHHEEEFETIAHLMAVERMDGTVSHTPREIKMVVNQIGALHRQRQDIVPLPHIAYYVLLQRDHAEVLKGLTDKTFPSEEAAAILGDNVQDSLAALAFGLEVSTSRQLLLEPILLAALSKPDIKTLLTLRDSTRGFFDVLDEAVVHGIKDWQKTAGIKLLHAVAALHDSNLLETHNSCRVERLLDRIAYAAVSVEQFAPLTKDAENGFLLLIKQKASSAGPLFRAYQNTMR
ncbi:MAG: P-loop NTPase fold protein, partial [Thermodesulfobacteriota bacterium]